MAIFTALATTLLTGTFLAGTIGVQIVAAGSAPFDSNLSKFISQYPEKYTSSVRATLCSIR